MIEIRKNHVSSDACGQNHMLNVLKYDERGGGWKGEKSRKLKEGSKSQRKGGQGKSTKARGKVVRAEGALSQREEQERKVKLWWKRRMY